MIQLALLFKEKAADDEPAEPTPPVEAEEVDEEEEEEPPRPPSPPREEPPPEEPEVFQEEQLDAFTAQYKTADEWVTALENAIKSGVRFLPEPFAWGVRLESGAFPEGRHMRESPARALFKHTKKATLVIDVSTWFIWYWSDDPRAEYGKPYFLEIATK
jgi:hypothetical protein